MNSLPIIKLLLNNHRNENVVQVIFKRNECILAILRTNTLMKWSKTMDSWYLPYSENIIQNMINFLRHKAWIDYTDLKHTKNTTTPTTSTIKNNNDVKTQRLEALPSEVGVKIEEFKYYLRSKRYSENTIKTYTEAITIFLRYFATKPIIEIVNNDMITFNNEYIIANKLSASFQNQVVNAVKLFFKIIQNKKIDMELIHRPKRAKVLPNVLSKEEVKAILNAHSNINWGIPLAHTNYC